jgi:hypothetical protein
LTRSDRRTDLSRPSHPLVSLSSIDVSITNEKERRERLTSGGGWLLGGPISTSAPPYSGDAEALHVMVFKGGGEKTPATTAAGSSAATRKPIPPHVLILIPCNLLCRLCPLLYRILVRKSQSFALGRLYFVYKIQNFGYCIHIIQIRAQNLKICGWLAGDRTAVGPISSPPLKTTGWDAPVLPEQGGGDVDMGKISSILGQRVTAEEPSVTTGVVFSPPPLKTIAWSAFASPE